MFVLHRFIHLLNTHLKVSSLINEKNEYRVNNLYLIATGGDYRDGLYYRQACVGIYSNEIYLDQFTDNDIILYLYTQLKHRVITLNPILFVEQNQSNLDQYGKCVQLDKSKEILEQNSFLVCKEVFDYLFNWGIQIGQDEDFIGMARVVTQAAIIQFILKLIEDTKDPVIQCIEVFFERIETREQSRKIFCEELSTLEYEIGKHARQKNETSTPESDHDDDIEEQAEDNHGGDDKEKLEDDHDGDIEGQSEDNHVGDDEEKPHSKKNWCSTEPPKKSAEDDHDGYDKEKP